MSSSERGLRELAEKALRLAATSTDGLTVEEEGDLLSEEGAAQAELFAAIKAHETVVAAVVRFERVAVELYGSTVVGCEDPRKTARRGLREAVAALMVRTGKEQADD